MSIVSKSYHDHADPVSDYCTKHTVNAHPLQIELQKETLEKSPMAGALGAPEVLSFGSSMIRLIQGKRILDIGTFTGASALAWAIAIPEDGKVITFDIDHTNYHKYGVPIISKSQQIYGKIQAIEGPAIDKLDQLIANGESGTFDFCFIDADKPNYSNYYDRAVTLLRKGGVIFVDNSLFRGNVCKAETRTSPNPIAIHEMNDKIYQDDRTYSALLNLADGVHVAFKK